MVYDTHWGVSCSSWMSLHLADLKQIDGGLLRSKCLVSVL